jgi:hypothetical protein
MIKEVARMMTDGVVPDMRGGQSVETTFTHGILTQACV